MICLECQRKNKATVADLEDNQDGQAAALRSWNWICVDECSSVSGRTEKFCGETQRNLEASKQLRFRIREIVELERAIRGLKPSEFVSKADGTALFLDNTDDGITEQHHCKKLALDLALHGFCLVEELIGMEYRVQ